MKVYRQAYSTATAESTPRVTLISLLEILLADRNIWHDKGLNTKMFAVLNCTLNIQFTRIFLHMKTFINYVIIGRETQQSAHSVLYSSRAGIYRSNEYLFCNAQQTLNTCPVTI